MLDAGYSILEGKLEMRPFFIEHPASSIEYLCAEAWMMANYRPFD
jgi:hypothetical protein